MNGAGLGVVLATVSVYIVEIATTDMRGFLGCFVQFLGSVGVLLTFVVGSYVNWWQLALIQVSCDWSPGRVLTSDWSSWPWWSPSCWRCWWCRRAPAGW